VKRRPGALSRIRVAPGGAIASSAATSGSIFITMPKPPP
jgi:hypothetical protein